MRRLFVVFAFLARAACAQTDFFTPLTHNGQGGGVSYVATTMACFRAPTPLGLTNGTLLGFALINVMSSGKKCGFAIYPDSDSGNAIATTGAVACDSGTAHLVTVASYTLTPGATYRFCTCANHASGQYLAISRPSAVLMNANTVITGQAANGCDVNGVPPTTTGALSTTTTPASPVIYVGK